MDFLMPTAWGWILGPVTIIFVIAHWDLSQLKYFLFNLWNKKNYLKFMLKVENKISNGANKDLGSMQVQRDRG